ncbi:MAG: hypothetical protein ABFE08_12275 [Armatimonadia bacterium]
MLGVCISAVVAGSLCPRRAVTAGDRNARAWLGQYEVELAGKGNAAFYLDLRDIMDGRQLRMPRLLGAVRFESAIDEADASDTMEAA